MKKLLLLILLSICIVNVAAPVWANPMGTKLPTLEGPPGDPQK